MSGRPERTTYMTSGKHHADPEPWVFTGTSTRTSFKGAWGLMQDYAPRPEFDNHNAVLVLFRKQRTPLIPLRAHAAGFLNGITRLVGEGAITVAEVEHARRVIAKLARVYA